MKLELKHYSAYLPFSVQLVYIETDLIEVLTGIYRDFIFTDCTEIDIQVKHSRFEDYKLCLIPLTFLSSEFSIHANKIMTIHEQKHRTTSKQVIQHQLLSLVNTSLSIEYRISKTHKWIIDYLLQNHFDIFGLIENGLAVDINSL